MKAYYEVTWYYYGTPPRHYPLPYSKTATLKQRGFVYQQRCRLVFGGSRFEHQAVHQLSGAFAQYLSVPRSKWWDRASLTSEKLLSRTFRTSHPFITHRIVRRYILICVCEYLAKKHSKTNKKMNQVQVQCHGLPS